MRSSRRGARGHQQQAHSEVTRTLVSRRRSFLGDLAGFGCATLLLPSASRAQNCRIRRIGLVLGDDGMGGGPAFRDTLRTLGYVEGENIFIEARERARADSTAELSRMDLELVVAQALTHALAVRAAKADYVGL